MAGFFSQDLVEKAQEAIRIMESFTLPTPSLASQGPTTSSGETELCMYTIHSYRVCLVTCIHKDKSMISWHTRKISTNVNFCPYVVIAIIL